MIKTALIGAGGISGTHLAFLKSRKDVELAGICDTNFIKAEERVRSFGGRAYKDIGQMLDSEKPQAVWVCTPPKVRSEPLLACAKRNIPVFCEKPAEAGLQEAESLNRKLAETKAKVQVGYVFRCIPAVKKLKEQMQDDKIHLVQSLYSCNLSLTDEISAPRFNKSITGGLLVEQATHNFDLLRYLFGEVSSVSGLASNPVHKKEGNYSIEEVISLSLKFESGMIASHCHSWAGDSWRNVITIIGEKRLYRLSLFDRILTVDTGEQKRELADPADSAYDYEDGIFLDMAVSGDWKKNPSTYEDAIKTLKLSLDAESAVAFPHQAK